MNPSRKAVIEVVSFAFDKVFYGNYNYLGFAYYMLSSGHTTPHKSVDPTDKPDKCAFTTLHDVTKKCQSKSHAYHGRPLQSFYNCPPKMHTRHCDTMVNIHILQSHLDHLFGKVLCKESWSVRPVRRHLSSKTDFLLQSQNNSEIFRQTRY